MTNDPTVVALTGWLDYDRDSLGALTDEQRIDYFEKRVHLVVINPLRRILKTEIMVEGSSAILIFGVALCSAIEATGKFLGGNNLKHADRFDHFVKTYMSRSLDQELTPGVTYRDVLRTHFRNGLAHGFSVCHGGFQGGIGEPYFIVEQVAGHPCLEINPTCLLEDFESGFARYLSGVKQAAATEEIRKNFLDVFARVFINGE